MLTPRSSGLLLALPILAATLSFAGVAAADEPAESPTALAAAPGATVVRAETRTDPKTGVQTVIVPQGCTATSQSSGQVVILCPSREPAPASAAPAPRLDSKWYGWQTLLVDGASLTTGILVATAGDGGAGGAMILGGYALGGPVVHWANGQVGKGFASLGLRLGAPLVGGLTGFALGAAGDSSGDDYGAAVGATLGMIAGGVAAVVIDSAALARKEVVVHDEQARRPKVQWAPTGGYDAKRQAATLGITGTF